MIYTDIKKTMRIISKLTDFYDYCLPYDYNTDIVFDRRDSFILTKDSILNSFKYHLRDNLPYTFFLLQICNTFWLFLVEIEYSNNEPINFSVILLKNWKNYDKKRCFIDFNIISFNSLFYLKIYDKKLKRMIYVKDKVINNVDKFVESVNNNNYKVICCLSQQMIPILKECGIVKCVNPSDIYYAIEEYLLKVKEMSERTESEGLTDKDRITNHGFDIKMSFRN